MEYLWPSDWRVSRFEMRVVPNTRVFPSQYSGRVQVMDLLGERFAVSLDLAPGSARGALAQRGQAREAFFDRLRGPLNTIRLWDLRFPVPSGTLRDGQPINVVNGSLAAVTVVNGSSQAVTVIGGTPHVPAAIAQLAGTVTISHIAGRTLKAGDLIGIGGQLVRVMSDAVADGSGQMPVEFLPRIRVAMGPGAVVTWDRPTATFMLKADGVPTVWRGGSFDGASLELTEVF